MEDENDCECKCDCASDTKSEAVLIFAAILTMLCTMIVALFTAWESVKNWKMCRRARRLLEAEQVRERDVELGQPPRHTNDSDSDSDSDSESPLEDYETAEE